MISGRCKKCGGVVTEENVFGRFYKCPTCGLLSNKSELLPE